MVIGVFCEVFTVFSFSQFHFPDPTTQVRYTEGSIIKVLPSLKIQCTEIRLEHVKRLEVVFYRLEVCESVVFNTNVVNGSGEFNGGR